MCTALYLKTDDPYFGRTLDLDCSYGEEVCVMPRRFPLDFRKMEAIPVHYAMIGMATVVGGTPLFYDAVNEQGLAMAGLNFPGNAWYPPYQAGKDNVTPFEFIPWILGTCKTVAEARQRMANMNLVNIPFGPQLPLSPLHWMVADGKEAIVVESMADGLHIYENPVGVMTNNPPFPYHCMNLNNYRNLHVENSASDFASALALEEFCQGLGAVGLPGDVSSMSRFVRAAFGAAHSVCPGDEVSSVGQFFHLLTSVEMNRGLCKTPSGKWDITVYSACMSLAQGRYYYATYGNRQISCVELHKTDLEAAAISRFPLVKEEQIYRQN